MDAHALEPKETLPASRKLGREEAREILAGTSRLVVAKGRKVDSIQVPAGDPGDETLERMLGPTGNLRAPTLRAGKTTLVGFEENAWRDALRVES